MGSSGYTYISPGTGFISKKIFEDMEKATKLVRQMAIDMDCHIHYAGTFGYQVTKESISEGLARLQVEPGDLISLENVGTVSENPCGEIMLFGLKSHAIYLGTTVAMLSEGNPYPLATVSFFYSDVLFGLSDIAPWRIYRVVSKARTSPEVP